MKHISIFVSTLGVGGAEKQAALLATILKKYYVVHFVALYGAADKSSYIESLLINNDIKIYPLIGSLVCKLKEYARILKENKIVCSFNYLTKCDFLGAIVEKSCGVKLIYNGIRNSELEFWKTMLEKVSHNIFATATIFNCYSGEDSFISKGLRTDKCITIPNCFQDIDSPIEREDKLLKRIITVGRFHPQKDYETIIKTIAILKLKRNDFVLDICGYGHMESKVRQWVKQYAVEDIVVFHIKPNNLPNLLRNSDIYISTSLFEGTSNSIMEALNCSLPVVATNVGDNEHLVLEGVNGHLHSIGDIKGLATSLNRLLDSVTLRNHMGIKGNSILKGNYSMEIFEKRYIKLLENA